MALRLPDILDAADAELSIGISSLEKRILRTYEQSYANVSRELDALRQKIASAPEIATITGSGTIQRGIPPSWLLQQERYTRLQGELLGLVGDLSTELGEELPASMRKAYELGLQSAEALVGPVDPRVVPQSYASVPDDTIRRFVAFSSTDPDRIAGRNPLATLLDTFRTEAGENAAGYARDVLVNGLARGRALRSVASELESGIRGMTASRALTIARTETLRAHREAHYQSYKANEKLVRSWTWTAAVENTERPPCAACFAQHGSEHPLDERMETHPNCRCRMVPRRLPFRGMEPTGPATRIRPGSQVFGELSPRLQRRILGPARFRAFQAGNLPLFRAAGYTDGPWGRTLRVTPLRNLGLDRFGRPLGTTTKAAPPLAPAAPPPAPMPRAELDAKIRGIEDEIVGNRKFETAVAFDDAGTIILDKRGAQFEVAFTDAEVDRMRAARAALVHNHPRAYTRPLSDGSFTGGTSFSEQDVLFTGVQRIPRIRAVSPGWRHELEWSSSWKGSTAEVADLRVAIRDATVAVKKESEAEIRALAAATNRQRFEIAKAAPRRSDDPAGFAAAVRQADELEASYKDRVIALEFEVNHRVWERVASSTGFFRYTRESR